MKQRQQFETARRAVQQWEDAHKDCILSAQEILSAPYDQLDDAIDDCLKVNTTNRTITLLFKYPYEIDLDRIKTPLHLLQWCVHLMSKNWIDKPILKAFIVKVCNLKGWDAHGP